MDVELISEPVLEAMHDFFHFSVGSASVWPYYTEWVSRKDHLSGTLQYWKLDSMEANICRMLIDLCILNLEFIKSKFTEITSFKLGI